MYSILRHLHSERLFRSICYVRVWGAENSKFMEASQDIDNVIPDRFRAGSVASDGTRQTMEPKQVDEIARQSNSADASLRRWSWRRLSKPRELPRSLTEVGFVVSRLAHAWIRQHSRAPLPRRKAIKSIDKSAVNTQKNDLTLMSIYWPTKCCVNSRI